MKILTAIIFLISIQSTSVIVKNNGDELKLKDLTIYQTVNKGSKESIQYTLRGKSEQISINSVRRISFKETLKRKKGITTYRAILVKNSNDKLDVEINMVKVEGMNASGELESLSLSTVDKISF